MVRVEFFFDAISPYTFLAWRTLRAYREIWRLEISFRPIFLPALIQGSQNSTPLTIVAKKRWMLDDIQRSVRWYGLTEAFQGVPGDFASRTTDGLALQRLLASAVESPQLSECEKWRLVDAAFEAYWLDGGLREGGVWKNIDGKFLTEVLTKAGINDTSFFEERKGVLRKNTQEAIERGFFGSPTIVFYVDELGRDSEDKSFAIFGSDRFEQAAFLLNKKWFGPNPSITSKL
jgi:glutathione S-transferase kappa 1